MEKKKIEHIMGLSMLAIITFMSLAINLSPKSIVATKSQANDKEENGEKKYKYVVAIDSGHGGYDPGKIGINDELEKDINLSISLKLRDELEKENIKVVMTRESDISLCTEEGTGKKSSDMRNRVSIVNDANPDICVSIHQNSYTSKTVKGAQVFYYSASEDGKRFAELLQELIKSDVDNTNKRMAKENSSYYILLNVKCPTVIVECGFLSNWDEATSLADEVYQQKLAETIKKAIIDYFE
jgi:N-acetylmuramoyl-L-alanine amidase